jgi:hypothetical protein
MITLSSEIDPSSVLFSQSTVTKAGHWISGFSSSQWNADKYTENLIKFVKMSDLETTSYDNRRLFCAKNVRNETENFKIQMCLLDGEYYSDFFQVKQFTLLFSLDNISAHRALCYPKNFRALIHFRTGQTDGFPLNGTIQTPNEIDLSERVKSFVALTIDEKNETILLKETFETEFIQHLSEASSKVYISPSYPLAYFEINSQLKERLKANINDYMEVIRYSQCPSFTLKDSSGNSDLNDYSRDVYEAHLEALEV